MIFVLKNSKKGNVNVNGVAFTNFMADVRNEKTIKKLMSNPMVQPLNVKEEETISKEIKKQTMADNLAKARAAKKQKEQQAKENGKLAAKSTTEE